MKFRIIAVGLIEKDKKYLLGKKPDNIGPYPNTWHLPGGGVNLDEESLDEALKREIKEEAGIEIKNIEQIGFDEDNEPDKHGEMTHYIFLDFKANCLSGEINANDDMKKLKWTTKYELKKLNLNKPTKKLFKKLKLI
jgi:8-oxo-dGTP diphosphatase